MVAVPSVPDGVLPPPDGEWFPCWWPPVPTGVLLPVDPVPPTGVAVSPPDGGEPMAPVVSEGAGCGAGAWDGGTTALGAPGEEAPFDHGQRSATLAR